MAWLVDHVSAMIREQGIDLYRQTSISSRSTLARERGGGRQGITEIRHVTGYMAYWDETPEALSNLLIDNLRVRWQARRPRNPPALGSLWRSDLRVRNRPPCSNSPMAMALGCPISDRGEFAGPIHLQKPDHPGDRGGPRTGPVRRMASPLPQARFGWRTAAPYYYGDYYPLTPYTTSASDWLAWQFNRPVEADGLVQAFRRPESSIEVSRYILRGLDASARYRVVDIDSPSTTRCLTGKELMERGTAGHGPKQAGRGYHHI